MICSVTFKFYDAESELIKTVVNHLVQLRTWAHQNNVPVVYTAQPYEQPAQIEHY